MAVVAIVGLVVAILGFIIAVWAGWTADKSRKAAERSASAAEKAVDLQHREAEAAEAVRRRNVLADVVPLKWESRVPANQTRMGSGQTYTGLVVTNRGQAAATDVRAECVVGKLFRVGERRFLLAGETYGFRDELKDFQPNSDNDLPPAAGDGDYLARAFWTNDDGSLGSSPWTPIPRF